MSTIATTKDLSRPLLQRQEFSIAHRHHGSLSAVSTIATIDARSWALSTRQALYREHCHRNKCSAMRLVTSAGDLPRAMSPRPALCREHCCPGRSYIMSILATTRFFAVSTVTTASVLTCAMSPRQELNREECLHGRCSTMSNVSTTGILPCALLLLQACRHTMCHSCYGRRFAMSNIVMLCRAWLPLLWHPELVPAMLVGALPAGTSLCEQPLVALPLLGGTPRRVAHVLTGALPASCALGGCTHPSRTPLAYVHLVGDNLNGCLTR